MECNEKKTAQPIVKEIPASAIGLPTSGAVIDEAQWTTAKSIKTGEEMEIFKITGWILPVDPAASDINFRINVPKDWNGKLLQIGGMAYNGFTPSGETADSCYFGIYCTPLEDNYATFGSDSGHQGEMWDPSFAVNDEVFMNYCYEHIKKTKDTACEAIWRFLGKRPKKVYFFGASTGGREAMEAVQHYPEDYDGILAACPGITLISRAIHDSAVTDAQVKDGGAGWISYEDWCRVEEVVYEFCDALDGVKDGLIGDLKGAAAKREEIVAAIKARKILSDAQLEVLELACTTWQSDFPLAEGTTVLPAWPWLVGASPYDPYYMPGLEIRNYGSEKGGRDSQMALTAYTLLQWMCMRSPDFDPAAFKISEHIPEIQKGSEMVDAASVNYDKFIAKGGRMIMTHGTCDQFISVYNATGYYDRLIERYGREKLDSFYHLYLVPGMGHANGARFLAATDFLGALDKWVCEGEAPEELVVTDLHPGHDSRRRPIYPYPAYAVYNGEGDVNSAESFHSSAE